MATQTLAVLPTQRTEHPHVVQTTGVCGGRPIIEGTRISVRHIAQLYKAGDAVEEILQAHPHLSATAVYDAISYYLDHQHEIEQEIAENRLRSLTVMHQFRVEQQGFVHFTEGMPSDQCRSFCF